MVHPNDGFTIWHVIGYSFGTAVAMVLVFYINKAKDDIFDFLLKAIGKKPKERPSKATVPVYVQPEIITRGEFEPRMKSVTDEIHFIHDDLSDKLLAHAAQARQDSKDTRDWLDKKLEAQFTKIDNFTNQVMLNLNGRGKT